MISMIISIIGIIKITDGIVIIVFIGPRYTWGPIYGSECLKLSEGLVLT